MRVAGAFFERKSHPEVDFLIIFSAMTLFTLTLASVFCYAVYEEYYGNDGEYEKKKKKGQ